MINHSLDGVDRDYALDFVHPIAALFIRRRRPAGAYLAATAVGAILTSNISAIVPEAERLLLERALLKQTFRLHKCAIGYHVTLERSSESTFCCRLS